MNLTGLRIISIPSVAFWRYLLVGVLAMLIATLSMTVPFVWDDLLIFRTYSAQDLQHVGVGNWDTLHIMTSGYRPLSTWFNHARFVAFGTNLVLQHLVNAMLLTGFVLTLMQCAERLDINPDAAMVAGVLVLCARYTAIHFAWMTEGMSGLKAVLMAAALLAQLDGRYRWSLAWFLIACLVREDALAIAPALVVLRHTRLPRWYIGGIGAVGVLIVALRMTLIGHSLIDHLGKVDRLSYPISLFLSLALGGVTTTSWVETALSCAWGVVAALGIIRVIYQPRAHRWLIAALGANTITIVNGRMDLLFVTMSLLLFAIVSAVPFRWLPVVLIVGALAGTINGNLVRDGLHTNRLVVMMNEDALQEVPGFVPEVPYDRESTRSPRLSFFLAP